jgi:hypothetical protein
VVTCSSNSIRNRSQRCYFRFQPRTWGQCLRYRGQAKQRCQWSAYQSCQRVAWLQVKQVLEGLRTQGALLCRGCGVDIRTRAVRHDLMIFQ